MKYNFILYFLLILSLKADSQYSLSGTIINDNGEKLSFATVFLENSQFGASTDEKGNYIIDNIPDGEYDFRVTFIGYHPFSQKIYMDGNKVFNIILKGEIYNLDKIEIQANRVGDNGPFTKSNLSKQTLQKENLGQDVPYLLQWTPSLVVTSDAGTGIGYTGLRMRGSDQTRINVTINGVPLNDAESHNVFWVDLPDLMGSVNNIQIQRGVGTSTNGAGAFGGSVSINTINNRINPYIDIAAGLGAFNTQKVSVNVGTGLLRNKYMIDGRYSLVRSKGYVDRGSADLNSMYFSASRITEKSSLRFNVLSGKELTYQAWYGVPEAKLYGNYDLLLDHYYNNLGSIYKSVQDSINLFNSDRRYNYYTYPDQVDNYRQTHLQMIHSVSLGLKTRLKSTLFYTKGKGYFEEFRYGDNFENYHLAPVFTSSGTKLTSADIVRRRWLDNDLLGFNGDIEYSMNKALSLQGGISGSHYSGNHFGNVVGISVPYPDNNKAKKYYDNTGIKSDISSYFRLLYGLTKHISLNGDIQIRHVQYSVKGEDNDLRNVNVTYNDLFFNPKMGLHYRFDKNNLGYFSYAVGHKEPSRGDFIDNAFGDLPVAEKLHNLELGYQLSRSVLSIESNIYYMNYKNQLVLTGELNDVGAPVRINVPHSFRLGWEASSKAVIMSNLIVQVSLNLSRNKISSFDEVIADYTNGFDKKITKHQNTDISFSPSSVLSLQIFYRPMSDFEIELSSKYVSKQYLDNTSDDGRKLPAYRFQNLRLSKEIKSKYWKMCKLTFMVNNLLNYKYSANGYSYSYYYGNLITENFYYPQAGRHIMSGINIGF